MLKSMVAAAVLVAGACGVVSGATILQPNEAQSKDTFVYSFLANGNFNGGSFPGFNLILASGKSTTAHDLRTLIQFDLAGVTMQSGDIATLNLFVADGGTVGFPVVNPSPAGAVTTQVFPVTASWDANTVTWNNQPTFGSTPVDTEIVDFINRYVSFDVTSLVESWLANPSSNNGFSIQQQAVVVNGGSVQSVYHSSGNLNRPFLYVGAVPEPAGLAMIAMGAVLLGRRR